MAFKSRWECHKREAGFMPKFIKLMTDDEEAVLVNLEAITRIRSRTAIRRN
jgi:hypothetical protein